MWQKEVHYMCFKNGIEKKGNILGAGLLLNVQLLRECLPRTGAAASLLPLTSSV